MTDALSDLLIAQHKSRGELIRAQTIAQSDAATPQDHLNVSLIKQRRADRALKLRATIRAVD